MPAPITLPYPCLVGLGAAGAEVTVPGYTRRAATLALAMDGRTVTNTSAVQWLMATASWGVIDTVTLWNDDGQLLATLPVTVPLEIRQYDTARIPPASIVLRQATDAGRVYGSLTFGSSTFGARHALVPIGLLDRPYGVGPYGTSGYGTIGAIGVPLERVFDQIHVCAPGTWAPGPCALAA